MKLKPHVQIILSTAFALTPYDNWTQGAFARDYIGRSKGENSPDACSFCVLGGMQAARRALGYSMQTYRQARDAVGAVLPNDTCVPEFNDQNSHKVVLKKLYEAAAKAQGGRI